MFRDFQAGLLVSVDFTSFQAVAIFRLDFVRDHCPLHDNICFVTFSKVLQIYLVSHKSNMQLICAFPVVNCLNQLYGIIEAVFIRNWIYDEKCVCPSDVFVYLRCITLKCNTPIISWNWSDEEERQQWNILSREKLYSTWLATEWWQKSPCIINCNNTERFLFPLETITFSW